MLFDDDVEFGPYDKAEGNARRAYELYEDGKMAQALIELERALEVNPTNSAWHFNKGLTLDAINQFDEAITEYETALQLSPDDLEILNALAVDYTRAGLYDRAISTFEYIQDLDPKFEPCYCNRIITYAEMGQHDMAEQMFYLAQQIDEDCALCYYNIGNSLFARGEFKRAVRCWLRTAELEPTHPQINYRIAQAYWSDRDRVRARDHFLVELRINPGDIDVIMDFALFLIEAGDLDAAKEKCNRILEQNPDYGPALFYLGEIALDQGDPERAASLFEEALKRDPTLAGPHYRLARCALAAQQREKVKAHLLAELDHEIEDANTLISIATMFLTIEDSEHATQCLLHAVGLDMRCADAYHYLGISAANKGQLVDAGQFLDHALELNPNHTPALRDSAYTYLADNQPAKAAERIARARALLPNDCELRMLDHSVRLILLVGRIAGLLRRLDPRAILRRRVSQP
jgi:tetratricopeptide (TPR) repeat protein